MKSVDHCPACGGRQFHQCVALDDVSQPRYQRFSEVKYGGLLDEWLAELRPEIAACGSCGHHWYRRQPTSAQLSLMYEQGRSLLAGPVSREPTPEMLDDMRRLARLSGQAKPRMLDFGSGFGRWARAAARVGFDVHAYEPSQVRGAEQIDEFTLVHNLDEVAREKFDVINLEQVLEHLPDPLETLDSMKAYALPTTIFRVRVPNILRPPEGGRVWLDWPFDGARVHVMAPFEHLHGFTPHSLVALARRAGFDVVTGWRLARCYPMNWVRGLASSVRPEWGSTSVLLTTGDRQG